jgi:peptide-methionine (R)-S-oxide reductase
MRRSEDEWKKILSPEQYAVLRNKATEAPFSGAFLYNDETGNYVCAACGYKLFSSEQKFDANSGWPSFSDVISGDSVSLKEDLSHGLRRIEVACNNCGSHLGHVFNDAPDQPTNMRFCINSLSLDFIPLNKSEKLNKEGKNEVLDR